MAWWIWKARCAWVFERKPVAVEAIAANILSTIQCNLGVCGNSQEETATPDSANVWKGPLPGTSKFNVDATVRSNKGCAASIIRNHNGKVLAVEACEVDTNSPEEAEARAMLMGLRAACQVPLSPCVVESDSHNIVRHGSMKRRVQCHGEYALS